MSSSNKVSGVVQQCDQDHEVSSTLRKKTAAAMTTAMAAKKQKIPKRGPGVAELEKMLREEDEKKGMKLNIIGGIVPSLHLLPMNNNKKMSIRSSPFISPSNNSLQKHLPPVPASYHFNSPRCDLPPVPAFRNANNSATFPIRPTPFKVSSKNSLQKNTTTTTTDSTNSQRDHLPPVPPFHVNAGNVGNSLGHNYVRGNKGGCREVYISRSGAYVPEKDLVPVMCEWKEEVSTGGGGGGGDTKKGAEAPNKEVDHGDFSSPLMVSTGFDGHTEMFPPPPMVHMNPSSNMNLLSWSPAILSSSSSSATTPSPSLSSRVYHQVDHPSDHISTLPHEQDKMADHANRSRPDDYNFHGPNVPCQPPSINNIALFNLGTAPSPFVRQRKSCVNEYHGNPSDHGSALFIKQFQFPSKEMKESNEGLFPRSSSSGLGPETSSVDKKSSFFSQQEDQNGEAEATLGSDFLEKCSEGTREIIDLNLKL